MVSHAKHYIVVANWKMNPLSMSEAKKLFLDIKKTTPKLHATHVVICPPNVFLQELKKLYIGKRLVFGAQDVFWKESGAFTGEISARQLQSVGAQYVIVGHSERRALGETDVNINKKLKTLVREGMIAVLCVGESERDTHGEYLSFLRNQLEESLRGIKVGELKSIIVAYEPIWAIGKTEFDAITPAKLHEAILYIRKIITELYSKDIGMSIKVLYGGSVEPENASMLLTDGQADGFLVGHASLSPEQFATILKITDTC